MDVFTPETLKILQSVLDDAWDSLRPSEQRGRARHKLLYAFLKRRPQASEILNVCAFRP